MKKTFLALGFGSMLATSALASGIPTLDVASLNQSILDYVQHLKDFEQMVESYKQQVLAYERQVKDATRPYAELYENVYSGYTELMNVADKITGMQDNMNEMVDYVKEHYGDSEFWKSCRLSSCDYDSAQDKSKAAQAGLNNQAMAAMSVNSGTRDQIKGLMQKIRQYESSASSSSDAGTAEQLQLLTKITAQSAQLQALIAQMNSRLSDTQAAAEKEKIANEVAKDLEDKKKIQQMYKSYKMEGIYQKSKNRQTINADDFGD